MTAAADGVVVRPVAAADESEWRRLWTAYLEFYETSVPDAVYGTTFARLRADDPTMPCGLVAQASRSEGPGGPLVGLVHYLFHSHCWRTERVTYLQDLYADPEARGRGVGRALIESVYAAADAAGAPSVYWLTQEFNTTARRLYDRIGEATPFVKYQRGPASRTR